MELRPQSWINEPAEYDDLLPESLMISAPADADFIVDPSDGTQITTAPFYSCDAPDEFTLTCRVNCRFKATYDSAVLMLYFHDRYWVKLCYEQTLWNKPSIVSVVTCERSDDCNGVSVGWDGVWLRMSRDRNGVVGLYYAGSDAQWRMHRVLHFPSAGPSAYARVGLVAQCPQGRSCISRFEHYDLRTYPVADIRSGNLAL